MPPPIRYPLPTLIAALILSLVAWRGAGWIRGVRDTLASRWTRAVAGPPVPESSTPRAIAGPIVRRALLLRDGIPVAPRPDARPTDAIARRMFVDVYDAWPLEGEPNHLRVGNRRPIGWIAAGAALPWDTRLVVRVDRLPSAGGGEPVGTGRVPVPVIATAGDSVEVAVWKPGAAWSEVAGRGRVRLADMPRGSLGVLLAREELPGLLAQSLAAESPEARDRVRLAAVLGRVLESSGWSKVDVERARAALPPRVFERPDDARAADRLAAANADPGVDASWGGHGFRFVPLDDLP